MTPPAGRRDRWLLWAALAVGLLAAALRLWGLFHNLPDDIHADENQIVRRAVRFGGGDLNPHFFYWPTLAMYVYFGLYGAYFVVGRLLGTFGSVDAFALEFIRDPSVFYGLARAAEVLSDAGAAALLCVLGGRVGGKAGAWTAGLAWAFFPPALEACRHARPDALMLVLSAAALWALAARADGRGLVWGGFLWGLAVSAKYNAVALAPAFAVVWFLDPAPMPQRLRRAAALTAAAAVGFLIGTPYALLDFRTFVDHFAGQSKTIAVGGPGNEGAAARAWVFYLKQALTPAGSPVLGGLALAGVWAGVRRRETFLLAVAAALAGVLLSAGMSRSASERYFTLGAWLVALLAAAGLKFLLDRLTAPKPRIAAAVFLGFLVLIPFVPPAAAHLRAAGLTDTRVLARRWVEQHVPVGEGILLDGTASRLPMSRAQLEDLLARARAAGHVKADQFALELRADEGRGHHLYLIRHEASRTVAGLQDYARQVQDLVPMEEGVDGLARRGITHVIFADDMFPSLYTDPARHPAAFRFYDEVRARCAPVALFPDDGRPRPGPVLRIYRVGRA